MDNLTDQEKSVLLARATELRIKYEPIVVMAYAQTMSHKEIVEEFCPDLYDSANMHMAWRAHIYSMKVTPHEDFRLRYVEWVRYRFPCYSPDAQRLWLDSILELLIEEGVVEERNDGSTN